MTRSAPRVAAVLAVLLVMATPVQALIPDPVENGLLARIAMALRVIQELRLAVQEKLHEQTYNRIRGYAFPSRLFDPILATTSAVVDVRRELQRLGCQWPTSYRTQSLIDLLLRRTSLCRSGHHATWGSHERFWDGPIQEANDYIATMTANMISERAERTNTTWVRAHRDLFEERAILRKSPGEANRAEAAALAWANEVAVGNNQILTQDLLVRQMARNLERFDQKKAADLNYYTYRGLGTLAGREWRGTPPDFTEVEF